MRIALIASSLRLAGAEKQFVYVARALRERGLDARVYYLGPGEHYQAVLSEAGVPLRQMFRRGQPLRMLIGLSRALFRFKPHVVLASQFGDLIFAGPAGRLVNALVLGGVRSDGFYELRTAGRRGRFLLGLAHGLIANSHRAKENLISRGIRGSKIAVLPNALDVVEFDRNAAFVVHALECPDAPDTLKGGPPTETCWVTAVGTLQQCKRFDRFLEALALARRREPAIFGILAGKDLGARPALERKAKALGLLPGHMAFIGECDRIPALLSRSRLLVLSSDYEGFPNVILEAMAAHLPVVTTPAGDAARIVEDGSTGFVVQTEDVQPMADCIVKLVQDSQLNAQMGQAGRRRVERDYGFSSLAERVLPIIGAFARQHRKDAVFNLLERSAGLRPGAIRQSQDRAGSETGAPAAVTGNLGSRTSAGELFQTP